MVSIGGEEVVVVGERIHFVNLSIYIWIALSKRRLTHFLIK